MNRIALLLVVLLGVMLPVGVLATAPTAAAYSPFAQACNSASNATVCSANGTNPVTGSNGVIRKASTIISRIAAVAAIIIMMIGGLQYVVSRGDSQKVANARMAIIGGAIGLGIIVAAQGILLLVLSRLQ